MTGLLAKTTGRMTIEATTIAPKRSFTAEGAGMTWNRKFSQMAQATKPLIPIDTFCMLGTIAGDDKAGNPFQHDPHLLKCRGFPATLSVRGS